MNIGIIAAAEQTQKACSFVNDQSVTEEAKRVAKIFTQIVSESYRDRHCGDHRSYDCTTEVSIVG